MGRYSRYQIDHERHPRRATWDVGYHPHSSVHRITPDIGRSRNIRGDAIMLSDSTGPDPLEARFSVGGIPGYPPNVVQFSDWSGGRPVAWAWDFGDGAASVEQHPIHVYTHSGVFLPSLIVSDGVRRNKIRSRSPVIVDHGHATGSPSRRLPPIILVSIGVMGYLLYRGIKNAVA